MSAVTVSFGSKADIHWTLLNERERPTAEVGNPQREEHMRASGLIGAIVGMLGAGINTSDRRHVSRTDRGLSQGLIAESLSELIVGNA
jgi:hypothetical protein